MADIKELLEYLERHLTWKNIAWMAAVIAAFIFGFYFCSAKRDKQEALLINSYTKEMKNFTDSVNDAKNKALIKETECKVQIWRNEKTIDSLKQIIRNYEKGDNQ